MAVPLVDPVISLGSIAKQLAATDTIITINKIVVNIFTSFLFIFSFLLIFYINSLKTRNLITLYSVYHILYFYATFLKIFHKFKYDLWY